MNALDLITANLARPMTHRVSTVYASGTVKTHETRGLGAAENWAVGERRKVGRKLIDRAIGAYVEVVEVIISEI